MKSKLLTREQFRASVLKRDGYKCVVCHTDANLTVHHIMDRKLFVDGGYYVDNGVTVCDECHWEMELSKILPHEVRLIANITNIILPTGLSPDKNYDKWGCEII